MHATTYISTADNYGQLSRSKLSRTLRLEHIAIALRRFKCIRTRLTRLYYYTVSLTRAIMHPDELLRFRLAAVHIMFQGCAHAIWNSKFFFSSLPQTVFRISQLPYRRHLSLSMFAPCTRYAIRGETIEEKTNLTTRTSFVGANKLVSNSLLMVLASYRTRNLLTYRRH